MKKQTRQAQVEHMIHQSLVNTFQHQDQLSFDQLAVATLEGLMLMEREEYLKSQQGQHDAGNGTYLVDPS